MLAIVDRHQELSQKSTNPQAGGRRPALDPADLAKLQRWVRAPTSTQRVVTRSLIVLLAAAGHTITSVADELGVTRRTVGLWQRRFLHGGPEALLQDAPGRGRKKGRDAATVARILQATRHESPAVGPRWTVRSLARYLGVSHATVHRVWREHGAGPVVPPRAIAIEETSDNGGPA